MILDEASNGIGATIDFATCRALGWSITVNDILSNKTLAEQDGHRLLSNFLSASTYSILQGR